MKVMIIRMNQTRAIFVVCVCLLVTASLIAQQKTSESQARQTVRAGLVAEAVPLDHVQKIALGPDGNYYLLDAGNHRIVVLDSEWRFVRQISEVGQGPGDLFGPYDFALAPTGEVYVLDGRKRVQWFSAEGKFLGGFQYNDECLALAVNDRHEVFLSQPGRGSLVTVYDRDGLPRRSFGDLKKVKNERYQSVANRSHLVAARDNSIYVSLDHQGLLQKYDAEGKLLWEKAIPGEQVEQMRNLFGEKSHPQGYGVTITTGDAGLPAFYVSLNLSLDEPRNKLYVPLNDGTIFVADAEGRPLQFLQHPPGKKNFYYSVTGNAQGRLVAASIWKGIYLITPV